MQVGAQRVAAATALLVAVACSDEEGGGVSPAASVVSGTGAVSAEPVLSASAPSASAPTFVAPPLPDEDLYPDSVAEQREAMFRRMKVVLDLPEDRLAAVRAIVERSPVIAQGNPAATRYAMTRKACRERREAAKVVDEQDPRCGRFMVPLWNPRAGETSADAEVCIDRYEFPGIPCEHPVTWVAAHEAAEICEAMGKRLCDAHEWEGACAGAVLPVESEYAFKLPRKESKHRHNEAREIVWAYGAEKDHKKCATGSTKSEECTASGGFKKCGSNTYPAGAFPECKSPFGVYDQHGNAAEHMNLPLREDQLARRGGLGETEMKGSWFIFDAYEAHPDDCRWRAPDWHATKVANPKSHHNYHLGFRCCMNVR